MLTRRQLLERGAVAGIGLALPLQFRLPGAAAGVPVDGSALARYVDQLPIPPRWSARQLADRGLTMAEGTHRFHRDLAPCATWGYGGAAYLGPTIEADVGRPLRYVARNRLGHHLLGIDESLHGPHEADDQHHPRVSVHLHGGYTAPTSDGHPEDTFGPGAEHVYRYANDQQPGTLWYHDHALGITRLNVYAGLAGFYLLRDPDAERGLPARQFEIPLAIQDKTLMAETDATALAYPDPWAPEFFGDVALVNGKAWPNLDVRRGRYRFRILNGSNSRIYNLELAASGPPVPWHQVGTDTGLLRHPVALDKLVLAPGERADVVVDFSGRSPGDRVRLQNAPLPPGVVSPADVDLPELMQFTVGSAAGFRGPLPRTLPSASGLSPADAVRRRNLLLTEIVDPSSGEPVIALLNNRRWDTDDVEEPQVDTVERWNVVNLTADTHPIHLHLVQFRLMNRQAIDGAAYLQAIFGTEELNPAHIGTGQWPYPSVDPYTTGSSTGPAPSEAGWKDTIQMHPGTVTRILVPFGPNAAAGIPFGQRRRRNPFTGDYVWHCHILEHEDNEMMLPYRLLG